MAKRSVPEVKIDGNRWLTTYADLMNNLLVMFIMMYAISVIDLSKYEKLVVSFSNTFGKTTKTVEVTGTGDFSIEDITKEQIDQLLVSPSPFPAGVASGSPKPDKRLEFGAIHTSTPSAEVSSKPSPSPDASPEPGELPPATPVPGKESKGESPEDEGDEEYDELVSRISNLLKQYGYDEQITVEKVGDFIYLRFREGVLFLPDQAVMKEGAASVLTNISAVIMDSYDLISDIDISGHTARIPNDLPSKENLFSWELSTNRALTVLEYLVKQCDMPQEKLSVTGYSCNQLLVKGNKEEDWAKNRRVEIRLTKAEHVAEGQESVQKAPPDASVAA